VNLHVTGCPHSCAQHYIGDIGLLGTKVRGEEGYQVLIGGGSDQDQCLARELISSIAYADRRAPNESFVHFSRRHSMEELQSFLTPDEAIAR
jgi:ferredoxin-nitrite reductase